MFEITNIVKGHVYEALGMNKPLSERRMEICLRCPLYSNRFGGICNSKLWLNPNTNEVALDEQPGFFQGCGCRLQAKTTLDYESCPADKW